MKEAEDQLVGCGEERARTLLTCLQVRAGGRGGKSREMERGGGGREGQRSEAARQKSVCVCAAEERICFECPRGEDVLGLHPAALHMAQRRCTAGRCEVKGPMKDFCFQCRRLILKSAASAAHAN